MCNTAQDMLTVIITLARPLCILILSKVPFELVAKGLKYKYLELNLNFQFGKLLQKILLPT